MTAVKNKKHIINEWLINYITRYDNENFTIFKESVGFLHIPIESEYNKALRDNQQLLNSNTHKW